MSEYADAGFIFAVLLFNAIIGTVQEYSASKAAAALQRMVSPHALVLRDGKKQQIEARHVVPGDIVLLESGDRVPADTRLMETGDFSVDQSMLTGESEAVEKNAEETLRDNAPRSEQHNMAFSGTIVTHGRSRGVVVATGMNTAMGDIAESVIGKEGEVPPLMQRMERFTYVITGFIVLSALIIAVISYIQGESLAEIVLTAIGLAVAAIPEGLPIAVTVALAIGMRRMAERKVIVRKLVAVESLGSCTLIAADKTGTLTRNQLTAEVITLPGGKQFRVSSGDSIVEGEIEAHAEKHSAEPEKTHEEEKEYA
jgi:P-type E1-E2 ATPase